MGKIAKLALQIARKWGVNIVTYGIRGATVSNLCFVIAHHQYSLSPLPSGLVAAPKVFRTGPCEGPTDQPMIYQYSLGSLLTGLVATHKVFRIV